MSAAVGAIAGIDVSFHPARCAAQLAELDGASASREPVRVEARLVAAISAPSAPRDAFFGPVSAWCRGPTWTFVGESTRVDVTGGSVEIVHIADAPERLALELGTHAALASRARHHLHAAVVRSPTGEIVLICGPSGAGKSTLSLALHRRGWEIGGDDIAYVGDDGCAWPLRREIRATHRTVALFSDLSWRPAPDEGKLLLDVPRRPMHGLPRALLFPAIGDAERSHALPMAPVDVVPQLLLGSAFATLPCQERARSALAALASRVPAHQIVLARDLLDDPASVADALLATIRA